MKSLIAILAVTLTSYCVVGVPVPSGGLFPFQGLPEIATGAWKAVENLSQPMLVLAVASTAGQVSQREDTATGGVITTVLRYTSYMCVDNNTFLATQEGMSYPSMTPIRQCSMIFINSTHRAANSLPLDGGQCPNAPFAGFNVSPNGAYISSNIYTSLDGVIPAVSPFICRNGTKSIAASTSSGPAMAPGASRSPPSIPPTTALPSMQIPTNFLRRGPANAQGLWATENKLQIGTLDGFYASVYDPISDIIYADRGVYDAHECFGVDAYKATAQQWKIYTNGSMSQLTGACEYGKSNTAETVLDIAVSSSLASCPEDLNDLADVGKFNYTLVEPLDHDPSRKCGSAAMAQHSRAAVLGAIVVSLACSYAQLLL